MSRKEYRVFKIEYRAPDGASPRAEGYAAVFNSETDLGYYREKIAPGAFTRALAEKQDVRCLFNHDPNHVLGRTKNSTLDLGQDNTGLKFSCDMADTSMGRDVHTLVKRGDVDQCSFGFVVRDEEVAYSDDGSVLRTIKDADLFDVSIVTYPAYEQTSVEARSREEVLKAYPKRSADECQCDCPECEEDNCEGCSDAECKDVNCRCMERSKTRAKLKTRLAEISMTF
jgi:hypothetical protein